MHIAIINICSFLAAILISFIYTFLHRKVDKKEFYKRLPLIFANLLTVVSVSFIAVCVFQQYFDLTTPTLYAFLGQFMLVMWLDDMEFYFWHRFLHSNRWMLRNVHRIHHKARNPLPMEFIYVHPLEWSGGTLGILVAFTLLVLFHGSVSVYVLWSYSFFRTIREADIHSGTRSYIMQYLPFLCSTKHHNLHHTTSRGNYASTFTYLDKLFHTDVRG